jgi:hypothetical protein
VAVATPFAIAAFLAVRESSAPRSPRNASMLPSPARAAKLAAGSAQPRSTAFSGPALSNAAAYIPAQCYASTRSPQADRAHNGCFVCHQTARAPNYTDDADVQTSLSFADYATENHWTNLRNPPPPPELSDAELLDWVRASNYLASDGSLELARRLDQPDAAWDANHDGAWNGFVPDCWFRIDASGFDVAPTGKKTGWRAYAATPVPGMFWPTNSGSAGDLLIRLPEAYRSDARGRENEQIYRLNLAIVEAYVKRENIAIPPTDERALGSDLDGNGVLGLATRVAFVWPPQQGRPFHYVGKAAALDSTKDGWPVAGLYPRGTELLHSVRYLDVVDGQVRMAARMKELRYMKKVRWLNYGQLEQVAAAEAREKFRSPDKLKRVFADAERGVTTGIGWLMQGFIESESGALRPQSVEETAACIGCHGGVGATVDATFSLARKLPESAFQGGWYHPSQRGWEGVSEPRRADGSGEYTHYLAEVGGGDDFRSNSELAQKFFREGGALDRRQSALAARDISLLILPSAERALGLDRAYLGLVRAQRFDAGRDITLGSAPELEQRVTQGSPTGVEIPVLPAWKRAERVAAR